VARGRLHGAYSKALIGVGGVAARTGRHLVLQAYADEVVPLPVPLTVADRTFDVSDDLAAYTGLDREIVDALVQRKLDSFRAEWYLTPPRLREDDWYYRATSTYVFANAVHVHEEPGLVNALIEPFGAPGIALDFGGGSGNLALALAARGWKVDYLERSAIQKDFTRFRVARHSLGDHVNVLDDWIPMQKDRYDLIIALDVLEHIPDLQLSLSSRLVPSLHAGGFLAESSPFSKTIANPMHHVHVGFEQWLTDLGMVFDSETPYCRFWKRS
jgi:hypothetical protein